jgi:hypothetical protein
MSSMCKRVSALVWLLCMGFVSTASAGQHWGDFKADQCTASGLRQYSAILWDIPWGASWEQACAHMPADINGHHFDAPARCVTTINEWGQFDVPDPSCATPGPPGCVGQVGEYEICGDESNSQQKCCPSDFSCNTVGPYTGSSGGLITTDHYCTRGQITCVGPENGHCSSNLLGFQAQRCVSPTVTIGSPCCTEPKKSNEYPLLYECGDTTKHPLWPSSCSTKWCAW